jgi:uncharacterized protein YdcH (DUF465 family)
MADLEGDVNRFKQEATKFQELDKRIKEITDAIRPLTDELRNLKKEKITLKKDICDFMAANSLEQCALKDSNSMLIYRKRKILVPVTKDVVLTDLQRFFGTKDMHKFNRLDYKAKADAIYKFIYEEEREYKFSDVLQNK